MVGKHERKVDEDMRRRIGGSLFSLALILFLVGVSFEEDFWTKAPGERSPIQQSQNETSDSAESYDHDNPRVSPLELDQKQEKQNEEEPVSEADQPPFIHENGLSILMMEDEKEAKTNLHFVTYQPEEHAVYISSLKGYESSKDTENLVEELEVEYNYPLDYYIRVDKGSLKTITEDVMKNSFVQKTLEQQEDRILDEDSESLNLGSLVSDMSQLSFGTLMSLNQLVTSLSQEVETNISVGEILALRGKYGMDKFLEPLEVKRGLEFKDSVPVMTEQEHDDSTTVADMLGGL